MTTEETATTDVPGTDTTTTATMATVDQTNPDTNRTLGFALYGRGVVTDGGRQPGSEPMRAVDHESGTDGISRRFDR